jgi:hypothetical protein
MLWLLALVVVVVALHDAIALVIAAIVAVVYYVSLHVHPDRDCQTCGGTGRHRGYVFLWTRRQCRDCAGAGRHRRLGNVILHPNRDVLFERSVNKAKERRNLPRA